MQQCQWRASHTSARIVHGVALDKRDGQHMVGFDQGFQGRRETQAGKYEAHGCTRVIMSVK